MPDSQIQQRLTYSIEYPVVFTENVLDPENPILAQTMDRLEENRVHRAMVFIDSNVAELLPQIVQHVMQYFRAYSDDIELAEEPRLIPGGEIIKNDYEVIAPMIAAMTDAHLCRHSFVIIIGGGAVLDAVGFAAAITHRGIRTIRIPTTALAQSGGGIGVKTGINFGGVKSAIGSYTPPFAVINDGQFLYSLQQKDWLSGVAEALRIGLIRDAAFFDELCEIAHSLSHHHSETATRLIQQSALLYLSELSVKNDPFETEVGQPLDFGHWAAHKLEMISSSEISYGEAVAMGVLIDSRYATEMGWLTEAEFERIYNAFLLVGFPLWFNELERVGADGNLELFQGIPEFQEHKGGTLTIIFPNGIGSWRFEHLIDLEVVERALNQLRDLATSAVVFSR